MSRSILVVCLITALLAVSSVRADEDVEMTTADEFTIAAPSTVAASERTDIIPAGVAAEKKKAVAAEAELAESARFAQTATTAEAQAAHVAAMAADKAKKKLKWPISIDHPVKRKGCWISQTHCVRYPGRFVGTFRDTWGEKNIGTGRSEKRCLKRAQEYHVYCGNPQAVSTTAKFRNTQRQRSYPSTGCWIHQAYCKRDSKWTGIFRDNWGEKKLGTGTNEARCLKRAREYAAWCGNSRKYTTIAEYRGSGNMRYYPRNRGCFIHQDVCRNHPGTVSAFPFRDLYGEKNVGAGKKEQNCHARAREYHAWCGNSQSDMTVAEFRPSRRRASYPAIDKVQVDRKYTFGTVSWSDSESYCKSKGKNLCMRSEMCGNGFPLRGRPRGDHWLAVRDMENGWVSIGTAFNKRVCKFHHQIEKGKYGKPTWGYDAYSHPVLCCDDPDEVVWAKSLALSKSISWQDAKDACGEDGLRLCPASAYCPGGPGEAPNGGMTEGDHWAPTGDYPNAWVAVGDYEATKRVCRMHDQLFGFPEWGTQRSTYEFKGHVRCCARKDACAKRPCQNGGQCSPTRKGYRCKCEKGFQGKNCQAQDHCALKPCQNGGECENLGSSGNYRCHCAAGFGGKDCEVKDPCSTNPCQNGAACTNKAEAKNGYKCACPQGFSGKNCQTKNPCAVKPRPCKNGAACVRTGEDEFHCKCAPGFRGKKCEVNIDDCTPAAIRSCKNGGKCVDGVNTYTCDCSGTKFAGPSCTQYPVKKVAAQVIGGKGELFVDDEERSNDLGANVVQMETHALPGSTFEISAVKKDDATTVGIIASFKFRGKRYRTGADWECSVDGGRTYRRAYVTDGPEVAKELAPRAKYIWAKPKYNAKKVTCRMHIPLKNLAPGTQVKLAVRNKIRPLCSRRRGGSVTHFYGEICSNGGVQWNHMHTRNRRGDLTREQCSWSRTAMKDNAAWLANWLGSCTEPPKMLFPKLPTSRASFYNKIEVVRDPCASGSNRCDTNAKCKWTTKGPLPYKCKCKKGFSGDGKRCVEIDNCAKNPCSANARCRRTGPGTHECRCKKGFFGNGVQCDAINNCNAKPSPCHARASCANTGPGLHKCTCNAGYEGDGVRCKPINLCNKRPRPCHKNAFCARNGPGTVRCTCKPGYKGDGKTCAEIDACAKKPCHKNARCFKTGPNRARCECKKGYKGNGKQCKPINMCKSSKPCHEKATCTYKSPGKYSCACHKGFEGDGKKCVAINMCSKKNPCHANARCKSTGPATYSCKCRTGFRGDGKHCKRINICKTANPCHPNAKCKPTGPGVAVCKCKKGYSGTGQECQPVNACKSSPCDPHAKCRMTGPGTFACSCKKGWTGNGKVCREFNACKKLRPCDPHSKCTKTGPGTFKCSCSEGFRGDGFTCVEINDCDTPGLCNANANCMKTGPGSHKCFCRRGFRGDGVHCTEIDPCLDRPCDKHATCTKTGPGKHTCKCIAGYEGTGKTCTEINACSAKPCDRHASCKPTGPATFKCDCQRGYRGDGKVCHEIESCKERPCPPNSECMPTAPGRHRCKCAKGYKWSRAAKSCTAINGCKQGPPQCSKFARCAPTGPGTVRCSCKAGYEGDGRKCKAINSCKNSPCGKGQKCTQTGPGTHKCSCKFGHRRVGKECVAIDKCKEALASRPLCSKESNCITTGPGTFRCGCLKGYKRNRLTGKCAAINNCLSNPCSKWAKCFSTGPGTHKCTCKPGFAGDGVRCDVQPGHKAVVINGQVHIVPHIKGDTHDQQLGVIEAMLGNIASEEPNTVASAFGGSVDTIGAGPGANMKPENGGAAGAAPAAPALPTASDALQAQTDARDHLEFVKQRVASLEASTAALAAAAKAETDELRKLREQSALENAKVIKALEQQTLSALDNVMDTTHGIMTHTPHPEGEHRPSMDLSSDQPRPGAASPEVGVAARK